MDADGLGVEHEARRGEGLDRSDLDGLGRRTPFVERLDMFRLELLTGDNCLFPFNPCLKLLKGLDLLGEVLKTDFIDDAKVEL